VSSRIDTSLCFVYNIYMGMKKIKNEIERYADKAYHEGYMWGFKDGSETEASKGQAFEEGVRAERQRIIGMFEMMSKQELEVGSATKSKQWHDAAGMVKLADHLENSDNFVEEEF